MCAAPTKAHKSVLRKRSQRELQDGILKGDQAQATEGQIDWNVYVANIWGHF